MHEIVKPVKWMGSSRKDLKNFPEPARHKAGTELNLVQEGLDPENWKPMSSVGQGVREIRVQVGGAFRLMYVVKFEEAIWVLHAFAKKTQKTSDSDLALAKSRYRELLRDRNNLQE